MIIRKKTNNPKLAIMQNTKIDKLKPLNHNELIQFEVDAIIEEYKSVRAEIVQRVSNQSSVINYALALIAAVIALTQLNPSLLVNINPGPIFLLASLLFSAFALMLIEQDINIAYLGKYTDFKLRKRMEEIINQDSSYLREIWQWEDWKNTTQYRKFPAFLFIYLIAASRYAITIIPSFIALIQYGHQRNQTNIPLWENAFYGFCIFALIWTILTAVFSGIRYITRKRE
jgi:hypothetical protein